MTNLDRWVKTRHAIADRYDHELRPLPIVLPTRVSDSYSALHLYCIQVEDRLSVFKALRAAGIGVNVHYIPVHLQPDYRQLGFCVGQYPNSENYYSRAISLPMHAGLSYQDQSHVISTLTSLLK